MKKRKKIVREFLWPRGTLAATSLLSSFADTIDLLPDLRLPRLKMAVHISEVWA